MDDQTREEKKQQLYRALRESKGLVNLACKIVKISRATFYNWKKEDKEFARKVDEIIEEQREEMNDYAEGKLFEHIKEGNVASLIFYLKTRHPNYRPKVIAELEGKVKVEAELSEEDKKLLKEAIKYATIRSITTEDLREPDIQENSGK